MTNSSADDVTGSQEPDNITPNNSRPLPDLPAATALKEPSEGADEKLEPTSGGATAGGNSGAVELYISTSRVFLAKIPECVPFPGSPRAGIRYQEERDSELRADILAHGVVEAIVVGSTSPPYPILSGNRRHAVVSQLQAEGHRVDLPARADPLTPLEAVIFASVQNVGRLQPTAMQQARSIDWSLANIESTQSRLAAALGVAEAKVSRLALLANLPGWVTDIVTDPQTLSENFAGMLQSDLNDTQAAKVMEKRALRLRNAGRTLPGPAAARYLISGIEAAEACDLVDKAGTRHATAKENARGGLTISIPPAFREDGSDLEQIHTDISAWLFELMKAGKEKAKAG